MKRIELENLSVEQLVGPDGKYGVKVLDANGNPSISMPMELIGDFSTDEPGVYIDNNNPHKVIYRAQQALT